MNGYTQVLDERPPWSVQGILVVLGIDKVFYHIVNVIVDVDLATLFCDIVSETPV